MKRGAERIVEHPIRGRPGAREPAGPDFLLVEMFQSIFKKRAPITLDAASSRPPETGSELHASHALPKLARRLRCSDHPGVLDLGTVVGSNLQFFIDLGCKITADDLLRPVETVLPPDAGPSPDGWKAPVAPRLEYPDESFDAVLVWDLFDFLAPADARVLARDLRRIVRPSGIVMAYFTSRETERREPTRRFRVAGPDRMEWTRIGTARTLRHVYQNRDIERMFEGFRTHTAVFLQNGTREMLLERRSLLSPAVGGGSALRR